MPSPAPKTTPPPSPEAIHLAKQVLNLYAHGQFPMADLHQRNTQTDPPTPAPLYIFDPDHRAIIPLDPNALRIPRSLRQRIRSNRFRITTNQAFTQVIQSCARTDPRTHDPQSGNWIDPQIIEIYQTLHQLGHAHSIEAWIESPPSPVPTGEVASRSDDDGGLPSPAPPSSPPSPHGRGKGEGPTNPSSPPPHAPPTLVAGLYGVKLGALFAGESMFSHPHLGGTDASKVCLAHLHHHLRTRGFTLLDCQYQTPHLASLGAIEITRAQYHTRLAKALEHNPDWLPFNPQATINALP